MTNEKIIKELERIITLIDGDRFTVENLDALIKKLRA